MSVQRVFARAHIKVDVELQVDVALERVYALKCEYMREHTYKLMSHFKSQCIQEILSPNGRNGCVVGEYTRGRGREEGREEGRKRVREEAQQRVRAERNIFLKRKYN